MHGQRRGSVAYLRLRAAPAHQPLHHQRVCVAMEMPSQYPGSVPKACAVGPGPVQTTCVMGTATNYLEQQATTRFHFN
jgi:hypothetical protein